MITLVKGTFMNSIRMFAFVAALLITVFLFRGIAGS
jgi:hypothetical protein